MLETIREYALERLVDPGGSSGGGTHSISPPSPRRRRSPSTRRPSGRHDSTSTTTTSSGPRLAGDARRRRRRRALRALGWFWPPAGCSGEGRGRLSDALSASGAGSRSRARAPTGGSTARRGDADSGRQQLEEAVELWRELGEGDELASALDSLGWPSSTTPATRPRRRGVRRGPRDPPRARRCSRRDSCARRRLPVLVALGEVERARRSHANCSRGPRGDPGRSTSPTTSSPTAR